DRSERLADGEVEHALRDELVVARDDVVVDPRERELRAAERLEVLSAADVGAGILRVADAVRVAVGEAGVGRADDAHAVARLGDVAGRGRRATHDAEIAGWVRARAGAVAAIGGARVRVRRARAVRRRESIRRTERAVAGAVLGDVTLAGGVAA